jgi:hypothetical protein
LNYDIFNGDADGVCSLVQLRKSNPKESVLITGVKRDINLLKSLAVERGDFVTVLDISMNKNMTDLYRILQNGASVFYADHHDPGDIPKHSNLKAFIDTAPDTCTSLIMNRYLKHTFANWAVVGAFGDNLNISATSLAANLSINADDLILLEKLGIYINYNSYGTDLNELYFNPAELYSLIVPYSDPLTFVKDARHVFDQLETGYKSDMHLAEKTRPTKVTDKTAVFLLPNKPWARRVSGVFSNNLANAFPDRAHAVITEKYNGNYLVSVRAPLNNRKGAVELCKLFPTGGGRAAAAGINELPTAHLNLFIDKLDKAYAS